MPTAIANSDLQKPTSCDVCADDLTELECVVPFDTDDEIIKKRIEAEIAADREALARVEAMAPRGEALKELVRKFPVPAEWWDEEE